MITPSRFLALVVAASAPAMVRGDPSCPPSALDKATAAYSQVFDHPERSLLFVFRGRLRGITTCVLDDPKVKEPCALEFEVTDVPWDFLTWFAHEVGFPADPPVKVISVSAPRRLPAEFPSLQPGTEWLVVVQNYGGSSARRTAMAPWCGPGGWLGQIRDEQVYFDPTGGGDPAQLTHLPWSEVRARILAPVEAVSPAERSQAARRILAGAQASRAQREQEARMQQELLDEVSGKNDDVKDLVRELSTDDPSKLMHALYTLRQKGSGAGAERAIQLLGHGDDYVWLNAAVYLGALKRPESIPYLIKALRHTAWRSDEDTVQLLRGLTGQTFGTDYQAWHSWWTAHHPEPFDWTSKLGPKPRL